MTQRKEVPDLPLSIFSKKDQLASDGKHLCLKHVYCTTNFSQIAVEFYIVKSSYLSCFWFSWGASFFPVFHGLTLLFYSKEKPYFRSFILNFSLFVLHSKSPNKSLMTTPKKQKSKATENQCTLRIRKHQTYAGSSFHDHSNTAQ